MNSRGWREPAGDASRVSTKATLLVAVMLAAACGGAIKRGPDGEIIRTVRDVRIAGNKKLSDDSIEGGLAMREPSGWIRRRHRHIDPLELERDRLRIESYYKRHGFFLARVTGVKITNVGARRADITFTVREGPRAKVSEVVIEGKLPPPPAPDRSALRDLVWLDKGESFYYDDFDGAAGRLEDALIHAGYARARVKGRAEVDPRTFAVRIRMTVRPRKRTRFGATEVTGNRLLPESAIRNRLSWREGDWFNPRKLASTRRRLMKFGRFSTARIDVAGDARGEAVAPMRVTVTEAPRNELRLGGGVGIDSAHFLIRGRAGYTRLGIWDPLNTLTMDLRPAYAFIRGIGGSESFVGSNQGFVGEFRAELRRDDLWLPLLRGTATFAYTLDEVEAYSTQGPKVGLALARSLLAERVRLGLGWKLRLLQFLRVDDLLDDATRSRLGVSSPYRLGWFEQSIAYDGRDNPLDAKRGMYAEVRLEEATALALGEFSYVLLTPELRGYVPLGSPRLIAASRVRYGTTLRGNLPITQRYFAGGASSHRGFPQRRLSPVAGDPAGDAVGIGGDTLLEANVEARFDFWKLAGEWLGLVVFADGGDVTQGTDALSASNLHWAVGMGLRYDTVVGPIRFDLGRRMNRLDDLEPGRRYAWHLSIGEAF